MNNREIQIRVMQAIADLRLDPYDYAKIVCCYLLAKMNIKYSSSNRYLDGLMDEALTEELNLHHIETNWIYKDALLTFGEFSEFLAENKLDENYRLFFDIATPYVAFNWDIVGTVQSLMTGIHSGKIREKYDDFVSALW